MPYNYITGEREAALSMVRAVIPKMDDSQLMLWATYGEGILAGRDLNSISNERTEDTTKGA